MKKLTAVFSVIFLLAGCSAGGNKPVVPSQDKNVTVNSGEYKSVANDEIKKSDEEFESVAYEKAAALLEDSKVIIIDVRSKEPYSEGHIPNAKNIPLKELEEKITQLNKNDIYLIVCKTGKTSETASSLLAKNGFKQIYNLSGGMDSWEGEVVN